jgi:hypothetical protein
MTDEEMALNLGRSCRIASMERQMDELWSMFLMRPSRLNSNDYLWMKSIEATAKLILQMDREQEQLFASSAGTSISSTSPTVGGGSSACSSLAREPTTPCSVVQLPIRLIGSAKT